MFASATTIDHESSIERFRHYRQRIRRSLALARKIAESSSRSDGMQALADGVLVLFGASSALVSFDGSQTLATVRPLDLGSRSTLESYARASSEQQDAMLVRDRAGKHATGFEVFLCFAVGAGQSEPVTVVLGWESDQSLLLPDGLERECFEHVISTCCHALVGLPDEEASDRIGFVSQISHGMRTPLNAIMGYSELIHEEIPEQDEQMREDTRRILDAARQLSMLLSDMIAYTRVETCQANLEREEVPLSKLVRGLEEDVRELLGERRNKLVFSLEPDASTRVKIDSKILRRSLSSLILSAVRSTFGGEIRVEIAQRSKLLCVDVRDNGVGMTDEQLTGAMKRYELIEQTIARGECGTGMELPLASRLVKMMGGHFFARSQVGVGTHVSFTIPLG